MSLKHRRLTGSLQIFRLQGERCPLNIQIKEPAPASAFIRAWRQLLLLFGSFEQNISRFLTLPRSNWVVNYRQRGAGWAYLRRPMGV